MTEQTSTTNPNTDVPGQSRFGSLRKRTQDGVQGIKRSVKEGKEALMQQRLKAWHPVLTPKWVIIMFGGLGLSFAAIGGVLLGYSASVVELVSEPYEAGIPVGAAKFIEFDVVQPMSGPIYVYYELTNFYQNNRRYVESVDNAQLEAGDDVETSADAYSATCDPYYDTTVTSADGVSSKKQLYPCGLIAKSVFNDTFTIKARVDGAIAYHNIQMDESPATISWAQDVAKKFNQANPFYEDSNGVLLINAIDMWILQTFPPQVCLPKSPMSAPVLNPVATYTTLDGMEVVACDFKDVSKPACEFQTPCIGEWEVKDNPSGWGINNGHFINWMRTAGLSTFRKLYGKINASFEEGDKIRVGIQSNFPAESYGGTKRVVLSTVTWVGGKNLFLGIAYVVIGSLAFLFACVYAFIQYKHPHRLADIDYVDWNDSRRGR